MKTLNNKLNIEFKNFMKDNKLDRIKKDGDSIMPDTNIEIRNSEDVIFTMHYLIDYLGKYIFADKIMNFEEIFKSTSKNI